MSLSGKCCCLSKESVGGEGGLLRLVRVFEFEKREGRCSMRRELLHPICIDGNVGLWVMVDLQREQ